MQLARVCYPQILLAYFMARRYRVLPETTVQQEFTMSTDDNIQMMRRWFKEVWNEGRLETIHDLLHPDGVAKGQRSAASEIRGPQEFEKFVREIRGAFPDIKLKVEDVFGADDKVVLRWSAVMTHTGDGLGMPPSGRKVRSQGITIARIRDGKIVEGWDSWDQLGMLEQIGAYTQPSAAA
jgi:steroid delta-isomerase-like uncharacterized protein